MGDWSAAKDIFAQRPEVLRYAITASYDTVLHVAARAVETKLTVKFVENLENLMRREDLELQNHDKDTAFLLAS